jgi:NitT/TauT family transport system substrate-binding protein
MTFHSLRNALALVVGLGLASALPAAEPVRLRVSTIPILDTAPLQVGIAKGFFAAEGLELDTTPTAGGAVGLPALAAGQVQLAFSNLISTVLGARAGMGFKIVAPGSETGASPPDLGGLVARPDRLPSNGKALEGKRIAVNTRHNIIWLYARAWVQATGGDPDRVSYLEVPFPQMADAVAGGRVDAAFIVDPFLSAALRSGTVAVVGWPFATVQPHVPVAQYVATEAYLREHPQTIERFVRAYRRAVDWTNANLGSEELAQIVAGYTRLAPELVRTLALTPYRKTVDAAGIEGVVALMRRHRMIDGPFDPRALLHRTATEVER